MESFTKTTLTFLLSLMIIFLSCILTSYPVMYLWNYISPVFSGVSSINIWEALAVSVICSILFKGGSSNKDY